MKIRCKKCYKVLGPQEEYCTYCGEHSDEVVENMNNKSNELDSAQKFKISLILFLCIAFIGTGIFMVTLGLIQNNLYGERDNLICRINSLFITSIVLIAILIFFLRKDLKSMFFNGTLKQLLFAVIPGFLVIAIMILLNKLLINNVDFLNIVPQDILALVKNKYVVQNNPGVGIPGIYITMLLIIVSEEIIFRRCLIDNFDDNTLLGDKAIIILSASIATVLDFMWLMSVDIIIMSLVLNILMAYIYINTNRSLILNIFLRVILITVIFLI